MLPLIPPHTHSYSEEQKHHLLRCNIVQELSKILDGFLHDPDVITETFGVIACLADKPPNHNTDEAHPTAPSPSTQHTTTVVDVFLEAASSLLIHQQVLHAVKRHHDHSTLIESALEVLIMLAQNGKSQPPILHSPFSILNSPFHSQFLCFPFHPHFSILYFPFQVTHSTISCFSFFILHSILSIFHSTFQDFQFSSVLHSPFQRPC